jgi:predicted nucleotidyltransferase
MTSMALDLELVAAISHFVKFFEENRIRYIIIGAVVPQILIDLREENGLGFGARRTADVDCSVHVGSWEEYYRIRESLIARGFRSVRSEPEHRLYYGNVPVDILPYGKDMLIGSTLVWPHSGSRMNMSGFDTMFELAKPERIGESLSVPVVPLPLAVYSKITAFLDSRRPKHLTDIIYMLAHYEEVTVSDRRYESALPASLAYELRGAYLLGMDLGGCVSSSAVAEISPFFGLIGESADAAIREAIRVARVTASEFTELLSAFRTGLQTQGR